jgi:glyoxylase-like metal-dependent hydrolase (beta-lactamase superfamily II)
MSWEPIRPDLWRFRDSCTVYAIAGPDGFLVVDAGTGAWLETADSLPGPIVALACTHYFRDHSAGAARAAKAGIPVFVPEYERAIFADSNQHFRERETYSVYDNLWDLFAPIEAVPVAGVLRDYATRSLAGLTVEVLPLPGVTISQCGLGIVLTDGARVALCGEAIHSPGRLARIAPLQYNYNDLSGVVQAIMASRTLRAWKPDLLLPSLGEPIEESTDEALERLETSLHALAAVRPGLRETLAGLDDAPLIRVSDHVWLDAHSVANTAYLLSDSGKALAIDYGYHRSTCAAWSSYARPARRRALLHGLDALKAQFGIDRIDTVLVSHFHDDHVAGIPVLQRLHGTRCWAAENFADLLERPDAHCFPCTWPVPIAVDRRLPLDEPFVWEEYTFTLHPMSGHTRFSALIGFVADGIRYAHTGDQYFFDGPDDFAGRHRQQNHVYRNGARLDGYAQSGAWLDTWRPQIVLQGHQPPFLTDEGFFAQIHRWNEDYAGLHRRAMPLGDDETHFDLDSWGGWIWPYRTLSETVAPFSVTVTVRNPLPTSAELIVRLIGPDGWEGTAATLRADARAEVSTTLTLTPAAPCRRQPFAVALTVDGRPFGQVAEALVTIGHPEF